MPNGMKDDMEFQKLANEYIGDSEDAVELAKSIMLMMYHQDQKRISGCIAQYGSCSKRHSDLDDEIGKVKDKQKDVFWRWVKQAPTWVLIPLMILVASMLGAKLAVFI